MKNRNTDFRSVIFSVSLITASFLFVLAPTLTKTSAQENEKAPSADAAESAAVKPIIAEEADTAVKEMSDTLKSAKEFSFNANISYDELLPSGQKIQYGGRLSGVVKRPGNVYAEYDGDFDGRKIWYDGKEVTVLDTEHNFYGKLPVPSKIDDAMDYLINEYGFTLPLSDIISSNPYASFMGNVSAGVVVGDSNINSMQCRHLAFVEKYIDWQLWVSEGKEALPCKLVITYKVIPGAPQYTAVFSDWDLKPEAGDSVFKAEIPKEAVKIDFIGLKNQ